jgi:hypothetical protein
VPDVARVGAAQDAREQAAVFGRQDDADHAHAAPKEPVHLLGEVGQLVDQQDVDFRALVLVDVVFGLAVAEVDPTAVPESDFIAGEVHPAGEVPDRKQRAKPRWTFKMVLVEVLADAPEQIDLQARDIRAPHDRGDAHQVAFAGAGGAAEQNFGRLA